MERQFIALALALIMCLSLVPMPAPAADEIPLDKTNYLPCEKITITANGVSTGRVHIVEAGSPKNTYGAT